MKGLAYLVCGLFCFMLALISLMIWNSVTGFVISFVMFMIEIVLFMSVQSVEGATR